jgi:putative MFS transporter
MATTACTIHLSLYASATASRATRAHGAPPPRRISYNASNLSDEIELNFFLVSLPLFASAYASARLMDSPHLGRRGSNAIFLGIVAITISAGALWPAAATPMSMFGTFAAEAAFNLIYLQVQELFPTALRGTAIGLCSGSSRVANMAASTLPIVLGPTAFLTLIGLLCFVALPISWFLLPETRGRELS